MESLEYDIIVIGGGHAGVEASLSSAKLGNKTLLCTLNIKKIANMPCNTAIGGSAKGIVVREIDALGGFMGIAADNNYLQMKVLNKSSGAGVQCLRAQCDKEKYPLFMQNLCLNTKGLTVRECEIKNILYKDDVILGIVDDKGVTIKTKALIISTGTYMDACIYRGVKKEFVGPDGEKASNGLSDTLRKMGIKLIRLKTGTPPRIAKESIDFSKTKLAPGTRGKHAFSYTTKKFLSFKKQMPCHLVFTNEKTHKIIRDNIKKSARYSVIKSVGPRYCPSIEEKIINFPNKNRQQLFLEQEYKDKNSIYMQGFSTSMPIEIQEKMVHSIEGLEKAKILKYAYAIEYDSLDPIELDLSLRIKKFKNFFSAGQICGTSGYEEAAGLGIMSGINASLYLKGRPPFILGRDESYIGVMISDITTKGIDEPYRLLSSRAEYRLLLRHDNADQRLTEKAYKLGLIDEKRFGEFRKKEEKIKKALEILKRNVFKKSEINKILIENKRKPIFSNEGTISAINLLRSGIKIKFLYKIIKDLKEIRLPEIAKIQIENNIIFEGYIKLQKEEINKFKKIEKILIPKNIDYFSFDNLSLEAREKLNKIRPISLGQASRIPGINYNDILTLSVNIKKMNSKK